MNKTVIQLAKHPIFKDCDAKMLERELDGAINTRELSGGEEIELTKGTSVCIILSGSAIAYSLDTSKTLILKKFSAGDIFGIASLFGNGEEISRVKSKGASRVAFIDNDAVRRIIVQDARANLAFIRFLSNRVSFLNQKMVRPLIPLVH